MIYWHILCKPKMISFVVTDIFLIQRPSLPCKHKNVIDHCFSRVHYSSAILQQFWFSFEYLSFFVIVSRERMNYEHITSKNGGHQSIAEPEMRMIHIF